MVANGELAKILRLTPEELVEKYKNRTLNLGQIVTIANFMRLTPEQTIRKFFPGFLYGYRRLAFRKEVANAKKQNWEEERRRNNSVPGNRKGKKGRPAECGS